MVASAHSSALFPLARPVRESPIRLLDMGRFLRLFRATALLVACHVAPVLAQRAADSLTLKRRLATLTGAARIPLLLDLVELRRDQPTASLALADEALALVQQSPSARDESRARAARAFALQGRGDYPPALAEAQQAQRLAVSTGDSLLLGAATYVLATVQWRMADYATALVSAVRARTLLAAVSPSATLVRTLSLIGAIHYATSDLEGALKGYMASMQMAESMHDEIAVARAHNNIGLVYLDMNRSAEGLAELQRALAIHERLGPKANLTNTLNNIGLAYLTLDRPREALPFLERALVNDRAEHNLYGQAKEYSNLGFAYEKLQEPQRALAYHEQALALRERVGDKDGIVRTTGALAEVRMQRGDTASAIPIFERAIALALEIGDRRDAADQLKLLATAKASVRDSAGAYRTYVRYHELQAALADSAVQRATAELDARYRSRERERELADVAALAASRQTTLRWVIAGSVLLAIVLALVAVLYALRVRAQRALAESEGRYRALFESSVVPYFLLDATSPRVLDLNVAARALCEPPPSTPLEIHELQPGWVRGALTRLVDGARDGILAFDDCWSEPDGRPRWTEVHASTISLGGKAALLVAVRDTTDGRLREEARQREEKVQALGVLAGGIAHDFNNALTAIVGHVSLAKTTQGDERADMLDAAEAAAMGASRLTRQLLAFAKGGQPARRVTNVADALHDAVRLAAAGSSMRVTLELPDDLWHASLDVGQFGQVVSNIVINAQQATGEGGLLRVRATNHEGPLPAGETASAGRYIRIAFEDNGNGIPEGIRHRVFDPYFTTKSGGSGLGLATAYAICRKHDGALTLGSRIGVGTTLTAWFPASSELAPFSTTSPSARPDGHGSILVLDDEPLVRHVLQRMLEQWGYRVECVADGRDAVQRYGERLKTGRPFDLLIMDLTIPGGMGGRQAIAEILAQDPEARAIVASGYSDDPTMANFREAGFRAALAKPFERAALGRVVSEVLEGART